MPPKVITCPLKPPTPYSTPSIVNTSPATKGAPQPPSPPTRFVTSPPRDETPPPKPKTPLPLHRVVSPVPSPKLNFSNPNTSNQMPKTSQNYPTDPTPESTPHNVLTPPPSAKKMGASQQPCSSTHLTSQPDFTEQNEQNYTTKCQNCGYVASLIIPFEIEKQKLELDHIKRMNQLVEQEKELEVI